GAQNHHISDERRGKTGEASFVQPPNVLGDALVRSTGSKAFIEQHWVDDLFRRSVQGRLAEVDLLEESTRHSVLLLAALFTRANREARRGARGRTLWERSVSQHEPRTTLGRKLFESGRQIPTVR